MMRKLPCFTVILLFAVSLSGLSSGRSLPLADSYMMRARGTEAIYWNPANLYDTSVNFRLPLTSISAYLTNSSFDIETYNYITGRFLTEADKQMILDQIDNHITIAAEGHVGVFATTIGNVGLASSINNYSRVSLSEQYLQLILFGNEEESYTFHEVNNYLSSITFMDFTLAYGNIVLPELFDGMPPTRFGVSGSILGGIHHIQSRDFRGSLSTTFDGMSFEQSFKLRDGFIGAGFKSMLAMATEPLPGLHAGVTLDNLFGFINWGLITEERSFRYSADSIYVSNISEDFFTEEITTSPVGSYTTPFSPELRIGLMYNFNDVEISADWIQGTGRSVVSEEKGRLAIGAQLSAAKHVPFQVGIAFGNSDYPWRVSYGLGIKTRVGEFGVGIQSIKAILPSPKSHGIGASFYASFRI